MKVLFFSPFADVWPHSFPEALVAEMCEKSGCEVTVVRCSGVLSSHCTAMSAAGLRATASSSEREKICQSCRRHSALLDTEFRFVSHYVEEYLHEADRLAVDRLIDSVTSSNWFDLQIDDVPIGKFAAYEFYLENKLNSYEIPEPLWPLYLGQLRNSLTVFFAAKKFLTELRPERVVVYNGLYSVNNVVMHVAESLGIAALTIHGGINIERLLETLTVSRTSRSMIVASRSSSWLTNQNTPISERSIAEVSKYLAFLWRGTGAFVYSSAKGSNSIVELRKKFSIRDDQKVVLCTTSSQDEALAALMVGAYPPRATEKLLFASQIEWLEHVIEMGRHHPEWSIIIRVHPREFPNRRENKLSQNAVLLMNILTDLPANVMVNWPDQGVSLYDLAQITDVLLNGISNAGMEYLLLGIPVVAHDPENLFTYPSELNYTAASVADYESVVAKAITDGWSFDHTRRAFRWKAFQFRRLSFDLGSAIPPWSARTPLRVLRGLRYQWKWPIPVGLILTIERARIRRRPTEISQAAVVVDTIRHPREKLSDSPLWRDDAYASESEENIALMAALSDLHKVFAVKDSAETGLESHMAAFLESHLEQPAIDVD